MDNKNKQMKYITVLDFEVGRVYQYNIKSQPGKFNDWNPDSEDLEYFLGGLGHNLSNCEWMVHSDNKVITK